MKQYFISALILWPLTVSSTDVLNLKKNGTFASALPQLNVASKPQDNFVDLTHTGREHVSEKPPMKLVTNISHSVHFITSQTINKVNETNVVNVTSNTANKIKETNGDLSINNTHILKASAKNNTNISDNTVTNISQNNKLTPKSDNRPNSSTTLKPTLKTSQPITTKKPVAKKPLVTVHDDEADSKNSLPNKTNALPHNVMNIDPILSEKKHKRSNYIVPIVAVILSVPLVAGLISILYKRGKDWWLHRNYRRMDYLIEGLYNS